MRVGVFTPLLSQLPLAAVLKKLAELHIDTVELATGNYVGDAHCKLSMLENASALSEFQKDLRRSRRQHQRVKLSRQRAASGSRPRRNTYREVSRKTILLAEKLGVPVDGRLLRMSRGFAQCHGSQLGHLPVASGLPQGSRLAMERSGRALLDRHAKFAADHGVKIAVEMHPGFVVV